MKRFLGGLFESAHLLGMALLFAAAATLTALTFPSVLDQAGFTLETGGRLFDKVEALMWSRGSWVAGAALLGALLAPYVRSDDGKAISWIRILLGGATVVCVVWLWRSTAEHSVFPADVETYADRHSPLARKSFSFTPWTALLFCTGLDLVLAAFQVHGYKRED